MLLFYVDTDRYYSQNNSLVNPPVMLIELDKFEYSIPKVLIQQEGQAQPSQ